MAQNRILDRQALYAALDDYREAQGLSWRQVKDITGVSTSAIFTKLAAGRAPDADNLLHLLLWLDADARDFVIEEPDLPDARLVEAVVDGASAATAGT